MHQVTILPKSNFEEGVIENLIQAIKDANSEVEIKHAEVKQLGYGVTWWEVVYIFILSEVGKTVISEITKSSIQWAKERFNSEDNDRPKYISIFGSEGIPITATLIHKSGEVEDKTEYAKEQGPIKFPPV